AWRSPGHVWAGLGVTLERDLSELSTHMCGLSRLCMGFVKFLAAKVFYHACAWMSEAWRSQSHVLMLCKRDEVCELADPPRICVVFYAYACKGWAWLPRLSVTELLRRGLELM
ncbi:hypothetical protein PIB30_106933, partial [Stylosanthes scabra]|nr:hypothetical protein [Stylosanthes scabra]